MTPRLHGFPPGIDEAVWLFPKDSFLKEHPCYMAAKAGDAAAAVELIADLALPLLNRLKERLPADACFVAPHAREAAGDNALPQVLAQACGMLAGGETDTDIVQISRVFHTGADPMERLASRAEFEGLVTPGRNHVLVDDVTTMGGTLAELSNYIQSHDGIVSGVVVLVNAGRLKQLRPSSVTIKKIQSRHGNQIEHLLGIRPGALTANEASYLVGFRSPDEIGNRLAKARQETDRRLRAKGLKG